MSRSMRGALQVLRYALWPSLLILPFLLFARGVNLAKAAGCTLGETCMSSADLVAYMYVAAAVLMWLGLALFLTVYVTWKAWQVVFRRTPNKPHGESH